MTYLLSQLCWWVIAALIIGLVSGWSTYLRTATSWRMGWLSLGLVVFVIGCVVAVLKWLPDAPGFWLDTALILFAAYIIGCFLGSWIHSLVSPRVSASDSPEVARKAPMATPVVIPAPAPVEATPVVATHYTPVVTEAKPTEHVVMEPVVTEPIVMEPIITPVVTKPGVTEHTSLDYPGVKPSSIPAPLKADDLKYIRGIGPKNEKILNELGVYRFCQIGDWTPDNANWVSHYIAFPGRIEREQWVQQGRSLCAGIDTEYSRQVKSGHIVIDERADDVLSDDDVRAFHHPLPQAADRVENEDQHAGSRPPGFSKPIGDKIDDLKLIKGIGHQNEGLLHGLGIWHFSQIAAWNEDHALWVGSYLAFPGRIEREEWIKQAAVLAHGGMTEFAERVKSGDVATSLDDGTHGQDNIERIDPKQ